MKWIQFDTNYFQCLNNSKINQTQLHQIRKWIEFDGSQQFNQFNQLKWIQFDANYSIVECNWLVSREGSGLLVFVLTFRLFWQSIELNRWQSADDAAAPPPPPPPPPRGGYIHQLSVANILYWSRGRSHHVIDRGRHFFSIFFCSFPSV